jgi:hypothetical protein
MANINKHTFHAFKIKYNGRTNRITTNIKISKAFDPAQRPDPPFPEHETTALWDTGATRSILTKETVAALQLEPVGTTIVKHYKGSSESNTYLVNIFLPNNVGVVGLLVTESKDIVGDFGAIIGMDIITMGDFAVTNVNNQTCMTFRIPSIQEIDYVLEANRIKYAGVSRNQPCPCGSGKKFKKCCLEKLNI